MSGQAVSQERRPAADGGGAADSGGRPAAAPYYVRKVRVGERYKAFGEGGGGSAISGLAGDDGRISLGMELDSILMDVAPDLYSHFGAFVREDMNNALRQVRTARAQGHDAHVRVVINQGNRTVEIHDVGTNGMPVSVFRDVYTVLGRSGNLDGRESGQKGIGRFAFLGASDTKVVETYARETGERYGFIIRGGKIFEPIPDDMLSIREFGSRTSVCVDPKHDFGGLEGYAREIAAAATVPVFLDTGDGGEVRIDGQGGLGCDCEDAVRIKEDDFEFVGCATCRSLPNRPSHATYLIGIPIGLNAHLPFVDVFETTTLNILDERKYEPTTSRDALASEAGKRICARLAEAVKSGLCSCDWNGERLPRKVPGLIEKLISSSPCIDAGDGVVRVMDIVGSGARRLATLMSRGHRVLKTTDRSEFDDSLPRAMLDRDGHNSGDNYILVRPLWRILDDANGRPLSYAPSTSLTWRRRAWDHVDAGKGPVLFLKDARDQEEFERLGVECLPQTKTCAGGRGTGRIKIYADTQSSECDIGGVTDRDVCVQKNPGLTSVLDVCRTMRRHGRRMLHLRLFADKSGASAGAGTPASTFGEMLAAADACEYRTSSGPMTGKEITAIPAERLAVCMGDDEFVRAMCDDRTAATASGGRIVVYDDEGMDDDRLWLAYGWRHRGAVPERLRADDLARAAFSVLGVSDKVAAGFNVDRANIGMVGELRMLSTTAQKDLYMRVCEIVCSDHGMEPGQMTVSGPAAEHISRIGPTPGDHGMCMAAARAMNDDEATSVGHDRYTYDCLWQEYLMRAAMGRIADLHGHVMFDGHGGSAGRSTRFETTDAAGMLYADLLGHLFGEASVSVEQRGGALMIDAVIGGAGGPAVHMGGSLFGMVFGSAVHYAIDAAPGGRIRIRGRIGTCDAG